MDREQCCVRISVQPSRGLVDEKFVVLIQKALPGVQLTIRAIHQCEDGHSWEAYAHYTADATGTVNVSEDSSLGGTYSGIEPMGLLWSLRPVPGSKPGSRIRKKNVETPMVVTISAYQGHLTEDFVDLLASAAVERWYMAPGVRRIPITEGNLTATLFLTLGPGPFPGLLDLWGGGGQLVEYRAALLASHGIASMTLDYLTCKITVETGKIVDYQYFETAYRVLQQHPQLISSRIPMMGLSLDVTLTLNLTVYSKVVKLRCAVGIGGSHVQPVDGYVEQMLKYFCSFSGEFNTSGDKLQTKNTRRQQTRGQHLRSAATFSMDREQCCVRISVQPSRGLVDEKFVVLVQKALPGVQLTIRAIHQCEDGHSWEAYAHYTADATGTVNVSEDSSLGGTYSGVEPMGLLWSLRPVPGSKPGNRIRKKNVETPMVVTISAYQGHLTEDFVDPLASAAVERWYMAPGVRRIPITEGNLTATLFLPPGPGPFPGLLDLWGAGGQLVEYRAALLASHGIASMTLDYLTCKITMETGKIVDYQYFETAYRVLQQHPQLISSRIALMGICLGASMTLKMAVYSQVMELKCAVCISGSHVLPVDATLEELLYSFPKMGRKTRFSEENEMILRDLLLPIPTDPSLKVDVGRLQCPLLLVVGEDDQNWVSQESAKDMKEMMEQAGNSHLLTVLSYPDTGHLIEPPYSPHFRTSIFRTVDTQKKVMTLWGGQTLEHSRAQEDSWKKILVFLRENL